MSLTLPPPTTTTYIALGAAAAAALLFIAVLLWALVRLRRRRRAGRRASREAASRARPPVPSAGTPVARVPPAVPLAPAASQVNESELTTELRQRLAGSPLDTVTEPDVGGLGAPPDRVIWVENGHELLVHLDSLVARVRPGLVLVSLDVEADQSGRTTVVVPFAVSESKGDEGNLIAVTEEYPRGDPAVVSHWGVTIQEGLWAALLGIVAGAADQRGHLPTAIAAAEGVLHLRSAPVSAAAGVLAS